MKRLFCEICVLTFPRGNPIQGIFWFHLMTFTTFARRTSLQAALPTCWKHPIRGFSPNRVALRSSWGSHGWLEDFHCACGQIRVLRSTGPNQEPVWKVHNTLQLYHFLCRGPSYAQRQIFWASMVPWDVNIFGSGMAYRARQPSASMASKSVKTRPVCSKCPSQLWKLCRSL